MKLILITLFVFLALLANSKILADGYNPQIRVKPIKTLSQFLTLATSQDPDEDERPIDIKSIFQQINNMQTRKAPLPSDLKNKLDSIGKQLGNTFSKRPDDTVKQFNSLCQEYGIPAVADPKNSSKNQSPSLPSQANLISGLQKLISSQTNSRLLAWIAINKKIKIWFISFWIRVFIWVPRCDWYYVVLAWIMGGQCLP